ncbi:IS1182 family transposase [Micromonospora viridifaciens]|uniref:IS1182 family transposase n=1 Tax=Micromonospora viridifaciens TaxID=1881 RepID=UPI000B5AD642|nr:IS1182 family transposase [Micromonospora viridifaciens]
MQPRSRVQIPEQTVLVARAAFPHGSVAMSARDELGEVFGDEQFAAAFGSRGAPAESPGALALVTALQYVENLTDRQAAQMVARAIDWKYALGLDLTDPGFDASVLSKFRARLVEHGLEEQVFTTMLTVLAGKGLVGAGGKQRTDSTHVIGAVRDLNRLELAGEAVRACLEALSVAAPAWLATVIDVGEWAHRYGPRVDSWRLPASAAKRDRLAQVYGADAVALLRAVFTPAAPPWLAEMPAVQTLRIVLVQNYHITTDTRGREVIRRREADTDGLPPARSRITSPYDTDTRWAAKGDDLFWNGYKVHLTETCDDEPHTAGQGDPADRRPAPNLITNVATTAATVPDVKATTGIHQQLHDRQLLPDEHYLDSGYPSAETIATAATSYGVTLVTPALLDQSAQARACGGFDKSAFTIDFDTRQVTCPQQRTSSHWHPATQRGTDVIVVKFAGPTCRPCPARAQCTTAKRGGRQLTFYPRDLHHALAAARTQQNTTGWADKYKLRAGVEGTISQALAITGIRRARYRGTAKTHLQHVFSAIALNLIRLHTWWTRHPLPPARTSNLQRLDLALAA